MRMKKTFCIKINSEITFEKHRSNVEKFAKKNLLLIAFITAVLLLKKNFLRMLLIVVLNFICFENLRQIDKIFHNIFKIACAACDFLKNDEE